MASGIREILGSKNRHMNFELVPNLPSSCSRNNVVGWPYPINRKLVSRRMKKISGAPKTSPHLKIQTFVLDKESMVSMEKHASLRLNSFLGLFPDTVSAAALPFLDHFIHNYETNLHDQTTFSLYTQLKPEATTDGSLTLIHDSDTNIVMEHYVIYSFLMSLFFKGIVQARDFINLPENHRVKLLEKPRRGVSVVLDTDTYNEIDDPFALVYALLSTESFIQKVQAYDK